MPVRGGSARCGFSLVEMLIVIAILGILGTASVSVLLASRPHTQLGQAEVEVIASLNEARQLAISEEVQTRFVIEETDTNGAAYSIERLDEGGSWVLVRTRPLPDLVFFDAAGTTFSGGIVRFTTRGSLVAGGNIRLAIDGRSRTFAGNLATGRFNYGAGSTR